MTQAKSRDKKVKGEGNKATAKAEKVNGKKNVVHGEGKAVKKLEKAIVKEEEVQPGHVVLKKEDEEKSVPHDYNKEGNGVVEWWNQDSLELKKKGEKRWDTLVHNGVAFPPPYVPHGIPILYCREKFEMTPEEEEVATMFAVLREHDYYRDSVFRRNFFESWRKILDKRRHPIRCLELCDFSAIYEWYVREREKRKNRTREEKKEQKLIDEKEVEPYRWCLWDGRREQVANFRVEPPGLFRGRGAHPLRGMLKKRIFPEDIVINIGKDAPIPQPPSGHKWKAVVHEQTVTWLATWYEPTIGQPKYVSLAASSAIKGQSDYAKFETARKLKDHIDDIRRSYMQDFSSREEFKKQRAVATYFIDKLALRVGNEKGEDEADTVGCCSLRKEHVELRPNNTVHFDFLGKDSIRYVNDVQILPEAYNLLQMFIRAKRGVIFYEVTPTQLNNYLKSFLKDLTAKVFRTYNASITLERWFKDRPVDANASLSDKLVYFNKANTEVAKLCNHQRAVPKTYHLTVQSLKHKAQHLQNTIDALKRARDTAKKNSVEQAAIEFFKQQDEIQYQWLNAYGTEEDIKAYDEVVKNRIIPKPTSEAKPKSKAKRVTKKVGAKSKKSKPAKGKSGSNKKVAAARKKTAGSDTVAAKVSAEKSGSKNKKGGKASAKGKKAPSSNVSGKKAPRKDRRVE